MPSQSFHFITDGTLPPLPPFRRWSNHARRGREGCRQIIQLGHSHKQTHFRHWGVGWGLFLEQRGTL